MKKARQLTGCDRDFLAELDRIFDALDQMNGFDERRRALRWAADCFGISIKHLGADADRAAT